MRTRTILIAAILVLGSGYAWQQVDTVSRARSEFVAAVSDSTGAVTFSARGLNNSDVVVYAFDQSGNGEGEDVVTRDEIMDQVRHGTLSAEFYNKGFRTVSGEEIERKP